MAACGCDKALTPGKPPGKQDVRESQQLERMGHEEMRKAKRYTVRRHTTQEASRHGDKGRWTQTRAHGHFLNGPIGNLGDIREKCAPHSAQPVRSGVGLTQ